MIWTDASVSFGKGGSGVLASCSFCGTKAILSFSAGPVCSSFSAKTCAILQAFRWSRQQQQACHLSSRLLRLSPHCPLHCLSFYLNLSGRNCLLSPLILSGYNGFPDTCFFQETARLMSWPDEERYSCPLQSLAVSLLLPLASTLLFSRT